MRNKRPAINPPATAGESKNISRLQGANNMKQNYISSAGGPRLPVPGAGRSVGGGWQ